MSIHEHTHSPTHTHTHTHTHTQLSPGAVKEASRIGASLGRCAECFWLSAGIFGFGRPVFKMTEMLSGFGATSSSSLTECFRKSVRRTLHGHFALRQSSRSCRRTFSGSFRPFVNELTGTCWLRCAAVNCRRLLVLQKRRVYKEVYRFLHTVCSHVYSYGACVFGLSGQ